MFKFIFLKTINWHFAFYLTFIHLDTNPSKKQFHSVWETSHSGEFMIFSWNSFQVLLGGSCKWWWWTWINDAKDCFLNSLLFNPAVNTDQQGLFQHTSVTVEGPKNLEALKTSCLICKLSWSCTYYLDTCLFKSKSYTSDKL